jgi:hypothetical protein
MTVLVDPIMLDTQDANAVEHWHATVMRGGMIASVVVTRVADAMWMARTQLRDRSFNPLGNGWKCGPFATHAAALHAGQAASLRLHKALVGTHRVTDTPRTIVFPQPVGGYQSKALRRFARAQQRAQTKRSPTPVPQPMLEMEMFA